MYQDITISTWVLENISQKNLWIGHIAKFLSNINSSLLSICILK